MPGKRSEGQKLVAIPMDSKLLGMMDRARGVKNRSQFIRDAIAKMLGLPEELSRAPDRVKTRGTGFERLACNVIEDTSTSEPGISPKKKNLNLNVKPSHE